VKKGGRVEDHNLLARCLQGPNHPLNGSVEKPRSRHRGNGSLKGIVGKGKTKEVEKPLTKGVGGGGWLIGGNRKGKVQEQSFSKEVTLDALGEKGTGKTPGVRGVRRKRANDSEKQVDPGMP